MEGYGLKQKLAPLYVLGAGSLWGLMGMFVRHFNDLGLGSLEIGELRMIMGLVVTGGYLAIFHRELLKIRWKDLWCFAGTGIGSLLLMKWMPMILWIILYMSFLRINYNL